MFPCLLILVDETCFCVLQDIDCSHVDLWDDAVASADRLHLEFFAETMPQANIVSVIRYLRSSSRFKPSDAWKVLLDEAWSKVEPKAVPWDD